MRQLRSEKMSATVTRVRRFSQRRCCCCFVFRSLSLAVITNPKPRAAGGAASTSLGAPAKESPSSCERCQSPRLASATSHQVFVPPVRISCSQFLQLLFQSAASSCSLPAQLGQPHARPSEWLQAFQRRGERTSPFEFMDFVADSAQFGRFSCDGCVR